MNKKSYIAPESFAFSFNLESSILTNSIPVSDKEGDQNLSNNGGWDSSNWTQSEETEEY